MNGNQEATIQSNAPDVKDMTGIKTKQPEEKQNEKE